MHATEPFDKVTVFATFHQLFLAQSTDQQPFMISFTFAGVNFDAAYNSANRLPAEAIEFTTPLALFLIRLSSFFSLSQFVSVIN